MSVYKRAGTKHWLLDVAGPDGRRIRRTSGTTDLSEARRKEAELVIEVGGPIFDIGRASTLVLSDLVERFLAYQRGIGRRSMRYFFEQQCLLFERWAGRDVKVRDLDLSRLQAYQAFRVAGASPSTANRSFQVLGRMFTLAVKWGLISTNPCRGIERLKEPGGRERFLNTQEQRALLEACREPFRSVVLAALRTGMRRGELLGLAKRDVDLQRGLVTLRRTKSGSPRRVPLLPAVRELLARLARHHTDDQAKLFISGRGTPYRPYGVRENFRRACRRAGLPGVRFHDLRHTFASDALAAGVPMMVLRDLLGHTSVKTTERYAHLADAQVRQALQALDSHLAAQSVLTVREGS